MMSYLSVRLTVAFILSLLSCQVWGQAAADPEADTGRAAARSSVQARQYMISAANPHAARAGARILAAGGSAIDAAVASQMVLNVVEPQSSGLGGGAFALHWHQAEQALTTFDGRETAPQNADDQLFVVNDKTMNWWQALAGGRAVGAPGVLAMLERMHKRYGKLAWKELFTDAIALAERGFVVSQRLHTLIKKRVNPALGRYDAAWQMFYRDGQPIAQGSVLKNPDLADTFRRIAQLGSRAFYQGDIARDIAQTVRQASDNPGLLTVDDLKRYQPKERPPVCAPFRQYKVCGMGPPTSGGITVLQILALLDQFPIATAKPLSAKSVHLFSQAARLAYADRGRYIADPDFVTVPTDKLLASDYIKQRAQLISPTMDQGQQRPGVLSGSAFSHYRDGINVDQPGTSHISIVDAEGNAIALTSSIEMAFGSTLMTRGFLLNNQLTDFSFAAYDSTENVVIANRVEGGKRPRSSMAPTMVFDAQNRLRMVLGSPGGSQIINYVAKTLWALIDWQYDIQQAIDLPHYANRNKATELEQGTSLSQLAPVLQNQGHRVNVKAMNSGLNGIVIGEQGVLYGGTDRRREGLVLGR